MNFCKSIIGIVLCGSFALLTGCATSTVSSDKPDLIPERRSGGNGPEAYCRRSGDNELEVVVRNQSGVDATKASKTQVKYSSGGDFKKPTDALAGGASDEVSFPLPGSCFNPDCRFTIQVDADNEIEESHRDAPDEHEFNNKVEGVCVG